jgi:long-chain-fatty-acid--[acyl-carrier-protein] ligase
MGTIGPLLPSMEKLVLHPERDEPVPAGEQGRLLVRGPNVFAGYLGQPASPFVQFNGQAWYDTGDLVRVDERGVLRFAGRRKRFVKLGGEMISLPAIEQALEQGYGIQEAPELAVMPTPNEEHPELVLLTTLAVNRQEVNAKVRQAGFSPLHNIRQVIQVEEIPLLGTGKTDYRQLGALLAQAV